MTEDASDEQHPVAAVETSSAPAAAASISGRTTDAAMSPLGVVLGAPRAALRLRIFLPAVVLVLAGRFAALTASRPHLFSHAPVFLPKADRDAMHAIVRAIEAAARLPAYQDTVLGWAPAIARIDHGPIGAFMGYDFHLTSDGPKLIEVNTNAGGAYLNAFLARAQVACCAEVEQGLARASLNAFDDAVVAMDTVALLVIVGGLRPGRLVWLHYARWLVAALTFQFAADIVETSIRTDWESIGRLDAIAAIRTFLNYFLERDLRELRTAGTEK